MDRSWLVQKSKSKNSKNLWKIDEISRILAIFHFLKNINRCSLNRLQFWLDPILQKHSKKFIKIHKIFGIFREKKNRKFLLQKWIVHGWYKNQKMSKILEILSNFARNEILVFFDPVGPQDAMFDKNRFFQTFSSFSKVRVKKRTIKLLMTGQ